MSTRRKTAEDAAIREWLELGPHRAAILCKRADSIPTTHRDYDLWQQALWRLEEVFEQYDKGKAFNATRMLDRLCSELVGVREERDDRRELAVEDGSSGGTKGSKTKQKKATEWKAPLDPEIRRLRARGLSASAIAYRIHGRTGKGHDAVRKHVAEVLKKLAK